jgi:hypothetical protein
LLLNAPMRTRTSNLLIRSQVLYPIELWAQFSMFFLRGGALKGSLRRAL